MPGHVAVYSWVNGMTGFNFEFTDSSSNIQHPGGGSIGDKVSLNIDEPWLKTRKEWTRLAKAIFLREDCGLEFSKPGVSRNRRFVIECNYLFIKIRQATRRGEISMVFPTDKYGDSMARGIIRQFDDNRINVKFEEEEAKRESI